MNCLKCFLGGASPKGFRTHFGEMIADTEYYTAKTRPSRLQDQVSAAQLRGILDQRCFCSFGYVPETFCGHCCKPRLQRKHKRVYSARGGKIWAYHDTENINDKMYTMMRILCAYHLFYLMCNYWKARELPQNEAPSKDQGCALPTELRQLAATHSISLKRRIALIIISHISRFVKRFFKKFFPAD